MLLKRGRKNGELDVDTKGPERRTYVEFDDAGVWKDDAVAMGASESEDEEIGSASA